MATKVSGVPRILEWEGSRRSRRRGRVGCGEGVSPYPLGEGSGEGAVSIPRTSFVFFVKIPFLMISGMFIFKAIRQWRGLEPPS